MDYRENKRVLTAEELRRMYNFEGIAKNTKAIEQARQGLTEVAAEQDNILKSLIINLSDVIESQSDISLWFYNGIPDLTTEPTISFDSYNDHIGDFYYDRDTGYVYEFLEDNGTYYWERKEDTGLVQAMALTNSEMDTLDNTRKVFFAEPTVPYSNGDWYIKNGDVYICQVSKSITEQYDENDFIIAPKYTDDTQANKLAGNLTIVAGQVTTIIQSLEEIVQKIEEDRYYVDEDGNQHLIAQATSELKQTLDQLQAAFQITGGHNIIKDSMGLLEDAVWDELEGGTYTHGYDAELIGKAISIASRSIMNGKLTSKSTNITGLLVGVQHTLSFMLSNDADTTTTVRLIGNSTVFERTFDEEITMEKIVFPFISDTTNYVLEIESSTPLSGKCYIYDLMLNVGDTMPWEPASGEIIGTVLKMSQQGLQIYCTGSEIATLMTSQGFQVRRYANGTLYEIVTEFTKDGFISKKGILTEMELGGYAFKTITNNNLKTLIIYKVSWGD